MNDSTIENRRIIRSLDVMPIKPIIWKPALLKTLGDVTRRRFDLWVASGKFPAADGVKFGHPWWYASTVEAWLANP